MKSFALIVYQNEKNHERPIWLFTRCGHLTRNGRFQTCRIAFLGDPESIKNKLEKLNSWGISEERVGEKIVNWFSLGFDLRLVGLNLEKLLSFENLQKWRKKGSMNCIFAPRQGFHVVLHAGGGWKWCGISSVMNARNAEECSSARSSTKRRDRAEHQRPSVVENRTPEMQNLRKLSSQRDRFSGQRCGAISGENRQVSELPLLSVQLF